MIACTLIVPIVAFIASSLQASKYESSAEVYINRQNLATALTGIQDSNLLSDEERALDTQASLAAVPAVAKRALELAHVTDRTPDELVEQSVISPKGQTDIIVFAVTDGVPRAAERLASAYAQAFTEYRAELDTKSVTKAREEVSAKLEALAAQGREDGRLYNSLEQSEQQLETLATLQTSRASVVREADRASRVAPKPLRNAVLGLVLGLVLGIGLAFLLDALDTRVRSTSEASELLGATLLARLPTPPKDLVKTDTLVMLARPQGAQAEAFRMLRTNLEFARMERGGVKTILVTSAVEEEGKSTTSANLAVALARSGDRVALVDLDLRRPFLHRFFELVHAPGVTDIALGKSNVEGALSTIDVSAGLLLANGHGPTETSSHGVLHVVPSGPLPPDPGEFVGTMRLASILDQIKSGHDIVILDAPPLLRVGDAMTLSTNVDGVLVVTRPELVRRSVLRETRRLLDAMRAPTLGFVIAGGKDGEPYGSPYGYRYGYGYGSDPTASNLATDDHRSAASVEEST